MSVYSPIRRWLTSRAMRAGRRSTLVAAPPAIAQVLVAQVQSLQQQANHQRSLGQLDVAEELYRQALAIDANYAAAWLGLGLLAMDRGENNAARAHFREVMQRHPESFDAPYFLGVICAAAGQDQEAMAHLNQALRIRPDFVPALRALAPLCQAGPSIESFKAALLAALAIRPGDAEIRLLHGIAMHAMGQHAEALAVFESILEEQPDRVEALLNQGQALWSLERYEESLAVCERLQRLQPELTAVHYLSSLIYLHFHRLDEARQAAQTALALSPDAAHTAWIMAVVDLRADDDASALRHLERALMLNPDLWEAKLAIASQAFFARQFERAWPAWEARHDQPRAVLQGDFGLIKGLGTQRRWRGEVDPGGVLYLWSEQGYGDILMMLGYVSEARLRFQGNVYLYCPPALARLAMPLVGVDRILLDRQAIPLQALNCPLFSLPLALGATGLPEPRSAYLYAPAAAREKFRARLAALKGFKLGLVWQGATGYSANQARNVPLALFNRLTQIPGITFVSMQKGATAEDLACFHGVLVNWMDEVEDFADTAALMQSMDLVISIDSAPAHLAGALGVPVWLLNRFRGEWRWGRARTDNVWYASMRVFYQEAPDDWVPVIENLAMSLEQAVRGRL